MPRSILSPRRRGGDHSQQNSVGIESPPRPLQKDASQHLLRSRPPLLEEEGKKLILDCRHPGLDTGASVQTLTGSGSEASASICLGRVWSQTAPAVVLNHLLHVTSDTRSYQTSAPTSTVPS